MAPSLRDLLPVYEVAKDVPNQRPQMNKQTSCFACNGLGYIGDNELVIECPVCGEQLRLKQIELMRTLLRAAKDKLISDLPCP